MKVSFAAPTVALAMLLAQQGENAAPRRPEIGKPAPVIRLNDQHGKAVQIAPREGGARWTVLAFFPKAATPG